MDVYAKLGSLLFKLKSSIICYGFCFSEWCDCNLDYTVVKHGVRILFFE